MNTSLPTTLSVNSTEKITLLTEMLNASVDCIKVINTDGNIIFMNRSGCQALDVSVDEKEFGMNWIALLPEAVRRRGKAALKKAVKGACSSFRGISILPDGTVTHWDNMLTPVLDSTGNATSIMCISRNITIQVQAEKKLKAISETDPLTGLPNRRMLKKHLRMALSRAHRRAGKVAVLVIDLDNFKNINDTLGHAAGDRVLTQFSADLKRLSPAQAFISRLGGDEFAIVLDIADADDLPDYANHLLNRVRQTVRFSHAQADFGLTIGAAIYPAHAATTDALMKCADMSMYQQKMNGKNGFRLFEGTDIQLKRTGAYEPARKRWNTG